MTKAETVSAAAVKGGKKGAKHDDDSDEEEGGQVHMMKQKVKITQNEGSLFLKKLNYDVT